jgi:integrase/recombinase XerD
MARRAPKGCYWRGSTLYGQVKVCGVKYRFSLGTGDPAVAKKRRAEEAERLRAAVKFGDQRRTWHDAVVAWAEDIKANVSESTALRYATSLDQVHQYLTTRFVDEIDKATLADVATKRRAKGVTNATIRRDLSAISSVLKFCEDHDWPGVTNHAALAVKRRVKERRDPIVLPEPADTEAVIAEAPGMLKAMIRVAWKLGARQEELASLTWPRIDLERRQATIVGKGNRLRVIDLHDAYGPLSDAERPGRGDFVFWHDDGERYREVSNRFFEARRAAAKTTKEKGERSILPFRFHDLRHRFAVDFLKERRGSIYDLQQHLGHTSVRTTEIYLAYLTPDEQRDAKQGTQKGTQYIGSERVSERNS